MSATSFLPNARVANVVTGAEHFCRFLCLAQKPFPDFDVARKPFYRHLQRSILSGRSLSFSARPKVFYFKGI
jgi:hypothetical protein